ncbi:MAG: alpha/beta hydrolase [Saprospiraceae bacterium]|nr:alpha/beta hydrolase [Saprospiraceae bacterium]
MRTTTMLCTKMDKIKGAIVLLVCLLLLSCTHSDKYSVISLEIPNGEIRLNTEINLPSGAGPFPAVILVHGSKNNTLDFYPKYSEYFAENEIVTVRFDKRGQGKSTGILWTAEFEDLAKDIVAIVEKLKTLPYVDSTKIGLWADSQGGWLILIADSLSSDLSFLVNKAGPVMTPLEQTLYDYENNYLRKKGAKDKAVSELRQWYRHVLVYLTRERSDSLWMSIRSVLEKYRRSAFFNSDHDKYYFSLLDNPGKMERKENIFLDPSGRSFDFDPVPYLMDLQTPMLYQIGTADHLNDVPACLDRLQEVANPAICIKVYENADHGIRVHRKPSLFLKPRFAKNYLEDLLEFIQKQTGNSGKE